MSKQKPVVNFPDDMRTPVDSEFIELQYLARGGHQPDPSARQTPDIGDMVSHGRKYGVTAEPAAEPFDSDYTCPACGSNDNPDHFNGRCPACGHEPE
jgi:hypothetical protein